MAEHDDRKKLQRALARMVALRKQVGEHREKLREHASARLDATSHAIDSANEAFKDPEHRHILTHRYLRTQIAESARLRAIEGRGKPADTDDNAKPR